MSRKERRKLAKMAAKGEVAGQDPAALERLFNDSAANFQAGRMKEAEAGLLDLQCLQPDVPEVLHLLALIELQTGRAGAATGHLEKAAAKLPGSANLQNLLGLALKELGRSEDAMAAYGRAIDINPGHAEAHVNLGAALHDLCRLEEARESFRRAIAAEPDFAPAHENLGMTLLIDGKFEEGWAEYAWCSGRNVYLSGDRVLDKPFWDGSDLDGRTLLVFAGQGIGDAVLYFRYLPMVAKKGGDVILQCPAPLMKLLKEAPAAADIQLVTEIGDKPFDLQAQLHALPGIFATTSNTIPADVPYLHPPGETPLALEQEGDFKVGLVWGGNPNQVNDRNRSTDLNHFRPLLNIEGCDFYSLQVGPQRDDIVRLGLDDRIADIGKDLDDFLTTASVIEQLDLVITIDTSVANLAGALGARVWTMLCYVPDWRWFLDREDSPWYPTMRLFRQPAEGDWDTVFAEVGNALGEQAEGKP